MAIIQRPPADKPGDDIIDSILITPESQIERGRQEINYHSTDRVLKTGRIVGNSFIQPGSIVEIQDKAGVVKGMVTGFSIQVVSNVTSLDISTNLDMECIK